MHVFTLQSGTDHFPLMESLVEGKKEHLVKKLEFEPGTLSLFRVNNVQVIYIAVK